MYPEKYYKIQKKLNEIKALGLDFPRASNVVNYLKLNKNAWSDEGIKDNYIIFILDQLQTRIDCKKALDKVKVAMKKEVKNG